MEPRKIPFTNRWMFNRVMLDESICRKVVRAATGVEPGRVDDLKRASADRAFRDELLQEFGIS